MTATAGRVIRAAVVAALFSVALTGCFPQKADPQPTPTDLAQPVLVGPRNPLVIPRVLAYCPVEDAVHYSGYPLVTDLVYICRGDGFHDSDGVSTYGPWESASRIDHPAALLKAYRASDARKRPGLCTYFGRDPLIVWVHRNGVTTAYYAPVDSCVNPTRAAIRAYQDAKRTLLVDVDRGAPNTSKKDAGG